MRAVITFHSLDDSGAVLSFPPRRFAAFLEGLVQAGTPILTYHELMTRDTGVTLTFDDGMRSVAQHALPVLRALGVPAHLFLTTGAVGRDNRWQSQPAHAPVFGMLDWDEVQACACGGLLIESHTRSHADLRTLSASRIAEECAAADDEIARRVGRVPRLFAYPYGLFDTRVKAAIAQRYDACFSTHMGYIGPRTDSLEVPRIDAYYLRPGWVRKALMSPLGRGYLMGRGWVRRCRGIR